MVEHVFLLFLFIYMYMFNKDITFYVLHINCFILFISFEMLFFLDTNDKISKWICFQIWWSKSTRFWVRFIFIKNSCLHTTYDTHKHFLYWNPNVRKKMAFKTTNENLILCIISDTISLLNKYDYYASLREIVQVFFLPKLLACCFFSR